MHLGEISDRAPVGVVEDILEVVIGLLLGGTADDAHGRPHLDGATALTRQSLGLGDAPGTGLWCFDRVEMHVRVADGELASGLGAAGVHHQRVCVIEGPWRTFHAVELVVRPLVIEAVFAGPDPLDDAPPLFALSVAGVVLLLGHPEHLELVLVPATDDVHAEASLANVVPCGHLLGRHEGMMQGNVDRAEHVEAPRRGQQATRPGNRFEAGPVGVGLASVALPPRDGHHALDPDLVRHLRQPAVVLPARLPALGERGIRSPTRAIGAEEPEPEAIAVHENGIALSHPRFLLPAAPHHARRTKEDSPFTRCFRGAPSDQRSRPRGRRPPPWRARSREQRGVSERSSFHWERGSGASRSTSRRSSTSTWSLRRPSTSHAPVASSLFSSTIATTTTNAMGANAMKSSNIRIERAGSTPAAQPGR